MNLKDPSVNEEFFFSVKRPAHSCLFILTS